MSDKLPDNVILLQGVFEEGFFDRFSGQPQDRIFILEGRPGLTAARSNGQALLKRKIKPTVLADNMPGFLFYKKKVKEVWIAYQSADAQGALCSIGALVLAVLALRHNVPVLLSRGTYQRELMAKEKEIFSFNGQRVSASGIRGYVPLVEWVDKKYITKIYS